MPRGHRFLWCWGPHSWGPRGAVGGPLAYPFSPRCPAARAATRGCEKRPGLCPSRDWGPCPRVCRLSGCPGPKRGAGPPARRGGARAMAAGTVRRAQEGAPRAASMAPGLARSALSPAPPPDPPAPGSDSAEPGHRLPAPLAQRLLPHPGCAVPLGSLAMGSLATNSGLRFASGQGPGSSCVSSSARSFAHAGSLHPSVHGPGRLGGARSSRHRRRPSPAGKAGTRAGEAGRGEGKRGASLD